MNRRQRPAGARLALPLWPLRTLPGPLKAGQPSLGSPTGRLPARSSGYLPATQPGPRRGAPRPLRACAQATRSELPGAPARALLLTDRPATCPGGLASPPERTRAVSPPLPTHPAQTGCAPGSLWRPRSGPATRLHEPPGPRSQTGARSVPQPAPPAGRQAAPSDSVVQLLARLGPEPVPALRPPAGPAHPADPRGRPEQLGPPPPGLPFPSTAHERWRPRPPRY